VSPLLDRDRLERNNVTSEEFVRQAYALAEVKDIAGWVACFNPDGVFKLENGRIQVFDCYPSGTVILGQLGVLGNLDAVLEQHVSV
jgi:hypothetical protein